MEDGQAWLNDFLGGGKKAPDLFSGGALWHDYLAFAWDLRTHEGVDEVEPAMAGVAGTGRPEVERLSPREFLFSFDGPHGECRGLAELDDDGRCVRLFTSLERLPSAPSSLPSREAGPDNRPFVLIVGAGQSGLALAARLRHEGVPNLVVEKNDRVGDNWRGRYDSLVLHDPVWANHLPFKPFPADWPTFIPKDMMGDWLEGYADRLDLNVRCGCRLQSARFDAGQNCWDIELSQAGGTRRLSVPHLVFAVGTSGFPHVPDFPGADTFAGQQMHSSAFVGGSRFAGQKVAIVGANNSAHDIAVDLVAHGAEPTLIQRSSTHVLPQKVVVEDIFGPLYAPEKNIDLVEADFLSLATPMREIEARGRALFTKVREEWSDYYDAISATGFTLDFAEDGSGILGKYRRTAGGYYIDVGGSQLIVDGKIGVRSGASVNALEKDGVRLSDGTKLAADAIVHATGFGSMEEWVAELIDRETADRIGRCWGYGSGYRGDPGPWEGELRNMWKPTAQPGLWFMGGNLAQARMYSRYLGLQLASRHRGLHPS